MEISEATKKYTAAIKKYTAGKDVVFPHLMYPAIGCRLEKGPDGKVLWTKVSSVTQAAGKVLRRLGFRPGSKDNQRAWVRPPKKTPKKSPKRPITNPAIEGTIVLHTSHIVGALNDLVSLLTSHGWRVSFEATSLSPEKPSKHKSVTLTYNNVRGNIGQLVHLLLQDKWHVLFINPEERKVPTALAPASGGRKRRQDYPELVGRVVSYMRSKRHPVSTGDLTREFRISGSQARKAFEVLAGRGEVRRIGAGGRGTKYKLN